MAKGQIKQKQTQKVIDKLERAFSIDATIGEACFYADISEATYYNWVKEDKVLLEKFNRLRHKPILKAREEVVKALEGNGEFSLKYLERKRKAEFSTRTENVNENIEVALTKEEIEEKKKKFLDD